MSTFYLNTPNDLLHPAGNGSSLSHALIPNSKRRVLVRYTDKEDHCRYYSGIILQSAPKLLERWIDGYGEACEADTPHPETAMITISRAFSPAHPELTSMNGQMKFLYIVQGANGSAKSKVVVIGDLMLAAAGMIHEASNGFSVVMSAVLHVKTTKALFETPGKPSPEMCFVRVDSCRRRVKRTCASLSGTLLATLASSWEMKEWLLCIYFFEG